MSVMTEYAFAFPVGSPVRVKDLQASGTVVSVMRDANDCQYRVIYCLNSERRDQWLFGFELEGV